MYTNLPYIILALAIIVCGLVIFVAAYLQKKQNNMLNLYIEANTISGLPFNIPVIIKGKVFVKGTPLIGPASAKDCVFYSCKIDDLIETEWNDGQVKSEWISKGLDNASRINFYLTDETGSIEVNPHGADIDTTHITEKYLDRDDLEREKEKRDPLNFNELVQTSRKIARERILETALLVGDEINIFGIVQLIGDNRIIQETKTYPLIITNKSKEQYLSGQKPKTYGLYIFAMAVIACGVFLLYDTVLAQK